MNWGIMILLCCTALPAHGAFEGVEGGSRSTAMGGASTAAIANSLAISTNPSLAASVVHCGVSMDYIPGVFEMEELSRGSFTFIVPMTAGTFAFTGSRFGFDLYREVSLTLTCARRISPELMVGVNVHWYSLVIQNYGSATTIGADIGLVATLSENLHWGFSARNVNAPAIGVEAERLPQVYSTGVAYQPSKECTIAADLVKDVQHPAGLSIGAEYEILGLLSLRGGSSSDPPMYSAGFGVRYSGVCLDYALSNHPDLGMTHQISISFLFGEL